MHRLGGTDADENSQHFHAGRPLRHRRIEAVSTLLDRGHVESRSVCDCLNMLVRMKIGISSGNCGKLAPMQIRNRLRELETRIKIRIVIPSAVASVPTGIEGQ